MTQGEIEIVIALTSHFICVKLELLQKHTQMVSGSKIKNPHLSPECYNDTAQ